MARHGSTAPFTVAHASATSPGLLAFAHAETFSFARVTLVRHGVRHAALLYWPHPETKPEHFQPAGVVEILAPRIDGIEPGDAVAIESDPDQALWDWRGDRAASVAAPSGS